MKSLPWYNLNELGVMHAAWKVSTSCSLFQLFQKLTSWLVLCLAFRAALQNRTFEVSLIINYLFLLIKIITTEA